VPASAWASVLPGPTRTENQDFLLPSTQRVSEKVRLLQQEQVKIWWAQLHGWGHRKHNV